MSTSTIAMLITWLPTIIVALCLVLSIVRGLMRGFRKSLILFINYLISMVAGFAIFFIAKEKILEFDLSFAFSSIGNVGGMDFTNAHTAYDAAEIFVKAYLVDYQALVQNPDIQQVIAALAGVVVSLALAVVCLFVIPLLIRIILYIIYLLFFKEGRYKRRKEREGDYYSKHALGGLLVGVVRGLIFGTLCVSLFSSIYFLAVGGNYEREDLKLNLDDFGVELPSAINQYVDVNAYYNAIKNSRKTGVGLIFEKLQFDYSRNGRKAPLDYFLFDTALSSPKIKSGRLDEEGNEILVRFELRPEIGGLINLFEEVVNSDIIIKDEKMTYFDLKQIDEQFEEEIASYIDSSVLWTDLVPHLIVGASEVIRDGGLPSIPENIKQYFTEENVEKIKQVDFPADLKKIFSVAIKAIKVAPKKLIYDLISGQELNQNEMIKTVLKLDKDIVEGIFNDLSEISLITKAVGPIALALEFDAVKDADYGKYLNDLDANEVDFAREIKNIGQIFGKISDLDLNIDRIMNSGNPDENDLNDPLRYIVELSMDDEKKELLHNLIDFAVAKDDAEDGSLLIGKIATGVIKYLADTQDLSAQIGDIWNDVKDNLIANYDVNQLNDDLHILVESGLRAVPLGVGLVGVGTENVFKLLTAVDAGELKNALIGSEEESGLFDLNALTYLDGEEKKSYLGDLIKGLLLNYLGEVVDSETVEAVTDWKKEVSALCDSISVIQGIDGIDKMDMNNILGTMPGLDNEDVDDLTESISNSLILSTIIKNAIINTLDSESMSVLNYKIDEVVHSWRENEDINWEDSFDTDGNLVAHGEINKILKVLVLFTEKDETGKSRFINDDNQIELSMNVLSKVRREETDVITNSDVLVYVLDSIVSNTINNVESIHFEMPEDLNWKNTYDDKGGLVEMGELYALVRILAIESLQEGGNVEISKLTDMKTVKNLSDSDITKLTDSKIVRTNLGTIIDDAIQDSLNIQNASEDVDDWSEELIALRDVLNIDIFTDESDNVNFDKMSDLKALSELEDSDIDTMTSSKVILKCLPQLVNDNIGSTLGDDKIGDVVENWNTELKALVKVLGNDKIVNNDGEFDVTLDNLAQLIKKNGDESLNYEDAENMAKSRIVMKAMSKKVKDMTSGGSSTVSLVIPEYLEDEDNTTTNWLNWSYTVEDNYQSGEFIKLILVLYHSRVVVIDQGAAKLLDSNLAEGMINITDHNIVSNSGVLYATLSDIIDTNEDLDKRDQAYKGGSRASALALKDNELNPDTLKDVLITKEEIVKALDILKGLDITDTNNIDVTAEKMIMTAKDDDFREDLITSNIFNITAVSRIVSNDSLDIPHDMKSKNDALWYYANVDDWASSQLNKMLVAINEIAVGSTALPAEKAKATIVLNGNNVTVNENTTNILNNLASVSSSNPLETKAEVALESKLIHLTISSKIEEQKTSSNIMIRDEAYANEEYLDGSILKTEIYINASEITLLVSFVSDNELSIDSIKASNLLSKVGIEDFRKDVCQSNILNITIVDKIVSEGSIDKPLAYNNAVADVWYYTQVDKSDWDDTELNRLLVAINEMQTGEAGKEAIVVTDDNIGVQDTDTVLKALNSEAESDDTKKKIEVVYNSDIMAYTISSKIDDEVESSHILIRDEAYGYTGHDIGEGIINEIEIQILLEFIVDNNITVTSINQEAVINAITVDDNRKIIAKSNILNITFVNQIINTPDDTIYVPYAVDYAKYNDDLAKWELDKEATGWYPSDTNDDDTVVLSEIYKLLRVMNIVGVEVSGGGDFDINAENIVNNKLTPLNIGLCFESDVIGYTLSHEIIVGSNVIDVPSVEVYDNGADSERDLFTAKFASSYDRFGYTYDFMTNEEAISFIGAIKAMGLGVQAADSAASNNFIENLNDDKINAIASSGIAVKLLSDSIIDQDVVTNIYPLTTATKVDVTIFEVGYKYVKGTEIARALNTALLLGINNVDSFNDIDHSAIASLNDEKIAAIRSSYIFDKIFSKLIAEDVFFGGMTILQMYNMAHPLAPINTVNSVLGDDVLSAKSETQVNVLTPADIETLISYARSL